MSARATLTITRCSVCGICQPQIVPGGKVVATPCAHLADRAIRYVEASATVVAGAEMDPQQEIAALREALIWTLGQFNEADCDYMRDCGGEQQENYEGALRMAYPDSPEEWA